MGLRENIPGIDVTERPWAQADAKTFGTTPGGVPGVEVTERPWSRADTKAFGRPDLAGSSPLRRAYDAFSGRDFVGPKQPSAIGKAGKALTSLGGKAAKALPGVGGALMVGNEALDVAKVAADPNASGVDVGTQAAEGAGKLASGVLGAKAGALAGSALGPIGTLVGGVGGGALGYFAGEQAIRGLRGAFGVDPTSPAERAPALGAPALSTPATPAAAQAPRAAAEPRDPQGMAPRPKPDQPAQAVNPSGTVTYDPETKTYSGTNVREGFTFNGSRNGGGNVSVVPGMSQAEIAATMSRPDPRLAEANRGALDFGPEPMIINAGRLGDDLRKSSKDSRGARMRDEMAMRERIADAQIRATLRGQDVGYAGQQLNADVTRRGQDVTREGQLLSSDTSRRGQDMNLYGQLAPKQMEMEMAARMRNLRAQYMEGGKGDPTTAAQLAARDGMADLAKQFMEQAQTEQALGEGRSKAVDKLFENRFMTPGKDGTPTRREDLEAAARHSLMQQTGGEYANLPVAEQNRAAVEAYQRVRLLDGANALRGNVFTAMGLANPPPAYANLPTAEQVKGGSLQRLGWTDLDSWIPGGPGKGDYKLSTPKNGTVPLRGDTVDQAVIKNLLDQGVTLR